MSEIPRSWDLVDQVCAIDSEIERLCSEKAEGRSGWWLRRNTDYVRELYKTGKLRPTALPNYRPPIRWEDIPLEIFAQATGNDASAIEIPEEILSPPPKRGRPRIYPASIAREMGCSDRNARRLVSAQKDRKRQRRKPDFIESYVLEKRQKRMKLCRERERLEGIETVVRHLEFLRNDRQFFDEKKFDPALRSLAEEMVKKEGLPASIAMIGYALGDGILLARLTLDVSEATVRRTLKGRLPDLKIRGSNLAKYVRGQFEDEF